MSRLSRPLSKNAVKKADAEFHAKHPELKGQPLSRTDPSQASLRREWVDLYKKHGGKVEPPKAGSKKVGKATASCPPKKKIPPMDKTKYPSQRKKYNSKLYKAFPTLKDNYEVLSPETGNYNCIAHTLGKNGEWVNPKTGTKADPLAEMDKMYAKQGYKRASSMDFNYEPGKQKVVVYAKKNPDGSIREVTHGAIQDRHGTWESKLGGGPLIRHETPDALNGPVYGEPVGVYKK